MTKQKRVLIIRYGAYGDCLVITPIIAELKRQGYYVILNISDRGAEVFDNNPNVDEVIVHVKDSVPPKKEALEAHWNKMVKDCRADEVINFTGTIECSLSFHPNDPEYVYTKEERAKIADINFYEYAAKHAEVELTDFRPQLFFTEEEIQSSLKYIRKDKFNILWCLAGSGKHKCYPWFTYVVGELLNNYNIHLITVGDGACSQLEYKDPNWTGLAGLVPMRTTMCLTSLVDLFVAPDTGSLHAAGCFDTPKIGLLGAVSKNQVTKHFKNDFSLEANCSCAPCYHLVYDMTFQCPVECVTNSAWCMAEGLPPERVYEQITKQIPDKFKK